MTRWDLGLGNPNLLAGVAAVVLVALCAVGLLAQRPRPPLAWAWAAITASALVLLTAALSRGGWCVAALLLIGLGCWPGAVLRRWLPWSILGMLIALVLIWPRGLERSTAATRLAGDRSIATRLHLWRGALLLIADLPWRGVGELGAGPAVHLVAGDPEHLRGHLPYGLTNVLSDPLQLAADDGLPLLGALLSAVATLVALGLTATYRGGGPLGLALAGGTLAWIGVGCFSYLWLSDLRIATALLGAQLAALLALTRQRCLNRHAVLVCTAAGIAVGGGLTLILAGMALAVSQSQWAADRPRLVRVTDPGLQPFAMAPRQASRGRLLWLPGPDETPDETRSQVLAVAAADGWTIYAAQPDRLPDVLPAELTAVIAREQRAADAVAISGHHGALVLLDCPPGPAGEAMAHDRRMLLVHGTPDARDWAAVNRRQVTDPRLQQVVEVHLGRLWATRVRRLWPQISRWLAGPPPTGSPL